MLFAILSIFALTCFMIRKLPNFCTYYAQKSQILLVNRLKSGVEVGEDRISDLRHFKPRTQIDDNLQNCICLRQKNFKISRCNFHLLPVWLCEMSPRLPKEVLACKAELDLPALINCIVIVHFFKIVLWDGVKHNSRCINSLKR